MINPLLIQEVFSQPWCIEQSFAQGLAMSVYGMMMQHNKSMPALTEGTPEQPPVKAFSYEPIHAFLPDSKTKQTENFAPGSVGIVMINGPIVQNSDYYYGIKGTVDAAEEFLQLEADPNIIGTVFVNNSGGGAVYAIKPLDDVLASLKKPVVTWSKQMIASAAYRLGARTKHMMMYHPHGIAGSLGTMSSFSDMQPMFEKWGMKFFEYYATESLLKNKTYNDARLGNGKALIKNVLDPMNAVFLSDIRSLRGDIISTKEEGIYQGETYLAEKAVKLGLIDSLGSLSDAINKVAELAGATSTRTTQTQKSNMNFPQLTSLSKKQDVSQEELEKVNAELAEAGITGHGLYPESLVTEAEAVTKERDELKQKLATAEQKTTDLNTQIGSLTKENGELKEKVAAGPAAAAGAVGKEDPKTEKTAAEKEAETMAGFSHNQYIQSFFGGR